MSEKLVNILMLLGGLCFVLGIWVMASYQEAIVFTKLTGKEVTTWEAMWADLRVQEQIKE